MIFWVCGNFPLQYRAYVRKGKKKKTKPVQVSGCSSPGSSFLLNSLFYQYFGMTYRLNHSSGMESRFGNCKFTLHYKQADYSKQMNCVNKAPPPSPPLWLVFWYHYCCFYYNYYYYSEASADSSAWNPLFISVTTSAARGAKRHGGLIGQRLSNLAGLPGKSVCRTREHKDELWSRGWRKNARCIWEDVETAGFALTAASQPAHVCTPASWHPSKTICEPWFTPFSK